MSPDPRPLSFLVVTAVLAAAAPAQTAPITLTQPPASFEISDSEPKDAVSADFDGDGNLDLAFTASVNGDVTVMLGDGHGGVREIQNFASGGAAWGLAVGRGNGRFQLTSSLTTGRFPIDLAAGDFDGDGGADLIGVCTFRAARCSSTATATARSRLARRCQEPSVCIAPVSRLPT